MTRRLIVYKEGDAYLVSQEFNGDKSEMEKLHKHTSIEVDWPEVVALFDGDDTPKMFEEAVRKAEKLYGYEPMSLDRETEMPTAQEVWIISHGNLLLTTRYGKPLVEWLADVAESFGFKSRCANSDSIDIRAKNTDGRWCTWFTIFPDSKGAHMISGSNTDQCNVWLHETRPDMTPERCIEFFEELSRTMGLYGGDKLKLSTWIDPEDWQKIAGVYDAYRDERYTGEKGEIQNGENT